MARIPNVRVKANKGKVSTRNKRASASDPKNVSATIMKEIEKQLQVMQDDAEKDKDEKRLMSLISYLSYSQYPGQPKNSKRICIANPMLIVSPNLTSSVLQIILCHVKNNQQS